MGINKTAPAVELDVVGDAAVSGDLDVAGELSGLHAEFTDTAATLGDVGTGYSCIIESNRTDYALAAPGIRCLDNEFTAPNGSAGSPTYSFTNDTDTGMYRATDELRFSVGGTERGAFFSGGTGGLTVSGDIEYTGSITDISDERAKKRIKMADSASCLDVIDNIELKTFDKIDPRTGALYKDQLGVIAQQVETVDDALVKHTGKSFEIGDDIHDDLMVVDETRLLYTLLGAVKELAQRGKKRPRA